MNERRFEPTIRCTLCLTRIFVLLLLDFVVFLLDLFSCFFVSDRSFWKKKKRNQPINQKKSSKNLNFCVIAIILPLLISVLSVQNVCSFSFIAVRKRKLYLNMESCETKRRDRLTLKCFYSIQKHENLSVFWIKWSIFGLNISLYKGISLKRQSELDIFICIYFLSICLLEVIWWIVEGCICCCSIHGISDNKEIVRSH